MELIAISRNLCVLAASSATMEDVCGRILLVRPSTACWGEWPEYVVKIVFMCVARLTMMGKDGCRPSASHCVSIRCSASRRV
eukprot:5242862-Amphidinium_carterae.1